MQREGRSGWQTNLILTAGIMATVFLALVLAQLDALQGRAPAQRPGLPIVNIQATAVAVGEVIPLELDAQLPGATAAAVAPAPDDLNPRPEFIRSVSEEGVISTVCGEVPEGWLLYTVQPGETLASLTAATQSSAAELTGANCMAEGQLTAGMQILVPRQPTAALCGPPQWWGRYQVRSGDTLGALARSRGTTIDEILRANCRDSFDLLAGQFIFLPPGFPAGDTAPLPQPSLTPLPPPTDVPTLAPLPTATTEPPSTSEPVPTPVPPTPTIPVVISTPRPTSTPPPVPTEPPPTEPPPPTDPPPTEPPTATPQPTPTDPPPTEPPTATPPILPTEPPPTEPPPTVIAITPDPP